VAGVAQRRFGCFDCHIRTLPLADSTEPARRPGVAEVSIPGVGVLPPLATRVADREGRKHIMGYGIGGILVLILVILAIIYFAKRV
jgi:hypothetical protein